MTAILLKASGVYADLRNMGLSSEEICDLAAWAETNTEEVTTIADYINPADK